ncbi:MAG: hypothetical protein M1817_002114 [Caeruleum heppii]|nr:MAG: hypothetical protein M1817_002114 [Caeruleum heppii]
MPPVRPKLSITLPRNFTFHYTDGQGPKTPEGDQAQEQQQPSPPRPYRLRTRRRARLDYATAQEHQVPLISTRDVPVPSIEAPEPIPDSQSIPNHILFRPAEGFLAPTPSNMRFTSPPRTPVAQSSLPLAGQVSDQPWSQHTEVHPADSITRPTSACSVLSDSSESSSTTSVSFPSTGGSCTSPESDAADPFVWPSSRKQTERRRTGSTINQGLCHGKSTQRTPLKGWTNDMDVHLWTTYLLYLQDPTVTPFRHVPGTVPPLGVCCRIARAARRSWRRPKVHPNGSSSKLEGRQVLRDVHDEANAVGDFGSPDTLTEDRSGSLTPKGSTVPRAFPKWPASSATRRRLRELCKSKYSPSGLRSRMFQSRSPTPFHRPFARLSTPLGRSTGQPPFSTKDMVFSLISDTATSMRPDGELARLAVEPTESQPNNTWFGQSLQQSHQPPATSSQFGLGIGGLEGSNTFPRLGSPFASRPRPSILQSSFADPDEPYRTQSDSVTLNGPTLMSPVELMAPLPLPTAIKRRAQQSLEDELSPGGTELQANLCQDLFGAPAESSHRRVRSRGFSLGDVSEGSRLASLVTPPAMYDSMNSSEFANLASFEETLGQGHPASSIAGPAQPLGSPFGGRLSDSPSAHGGRRGESAATWGPSFRPRCSLAQAFDAAPSIAETLAHSENDDSSRKRLRG